METTMHHTAAQSANITEIQEQLQSKAQFKYLKTAQLFNSFASATTDAPNFVVFNGVKGTSKTYFAAHYLQEFCYQQGMILRHCEKIIKLNSHLLNSAENKDAYIDEAFEQAKGNLIIISDFRYGKHNSLLITNKINAIQNDATFNNTVVILSASYQDNRDFILKNGWQSLFQYRLDFYTPSVNQLTDTFANYLYDKCEKILSQDAKLAIRWYFKKREAIAKLKNEAFAYASEMAMLQRQIAYTYCNDLLIDKNAIHQLPNYIRLQSQLN